MADQNSPQGRRPHYHRGRRGSDRRGLDRRTPQHPQDQHGARDHVDVEQIMREIRTRISQRHGIELSNQQIEELAARRLEAILEPRHVKPALLEQLRRSASEPSDAAPVAADGGYSFEDTTLYESHRGILRFVRRLLNPILKLFFNPNPIVHALNTQARLNREAAARDAARDRTQAEWNALHYEILQRLVTEVSRVSIEMQNLSMRVESLGAKVEFNERRVRGLEQQNFQHGRPHAPRQSDIPSQPAVAATEVGAGETGAAAETPAEGGRRRRRRRRGRRGGGGGLEGVATPAEAAAGAPDNEEIDNGEDAEGADVDTEPSAVAQAESDVVVSHEPVVAMSPLQPSEPHVPQDSHVSEPVAPPPAPEPQGQAAAPPLPTEPTPPRDEPLPPAPVDHADPGPTDR